MHRTNKYIVILPNNWQTPKYCFIFICFFFVFFFANRQSGFIHSFSFVFLFVTFLFARMNTNWLKYYFIVSCQMWISIWAQRKKNRKQRKQQNIEMLFDGSYLSWTTTEIHSKSLLIKYSAFVLSAKNVELRVFHDGNMWIGGFLYLIFRCRSIVSLFFSFCITFVLYLSLFNFVFHVLCSIMYVCDDIKASHFALYRWK